MFARLLVLILGTTLIAAWLLELRHRRLELMHEKTQLHRQIDTARQEIWDRQVRIAERLQPGALYEAFGRAELELRPMLPAPLEGIDPARPPVGELEPSAHD